MSNDLTIIDRNDSIRALLQGVLTWRKNELGQAVLLRELTPQERGWLEHRFRGLSAHLRPAPHGQIVSRIAEMFLGFGSAQNIGKKDALTIAAKYAEVLSRLPLWAIDRACGKFERGEVTADQVEGVNRAFGPSTAQLHAVADALVGEFYREQREVYACLHGVVEHEPTPEERERVKKGLEELAARLAEASKPERPEPEPWSGPSDDDLQRLYGRRVRDERQGEDGQEAWSGSG